MSKIGQRDAEPAGPTREDLTCPLCGRDRSLLVERGEGGAPAKCVMYHPGLDKPGIRRYSRKGECYLVGEDGIKRRDYEHDSIQHRNS